jgi:hypothetical protein
MSPIALALWLVAFYFVMGLGVLTAAGVLVPR